MSGFHVVPDSVDIGDAEIPYLHGGSGGPMIVFMHATGFLPWLWTPIARRLSDRFRFVAPYFCDHREADPENGGFSWMILAQDLVRFCERLDLKNPLMVGHSMGGALIAIAAGKFGLDVKKMVLVEPIFLPREIYTIPLQVDDHPLASKSIKRRNSWKDASEARAYLKSKRLFASWDDEMLDLYVRYGMIDSSAGGLELACHPQREAALFMGSKAYDPWPVLPQIRCPVLVLEGEHTENKGFIDQEKAARAFTNGKYYKVKDAGHLIPMEKPEETSLIIREFFEE